jgi:hypothetical protein
MGADVMAGDLPAGFKLDDLPTGFKLDDVPAGFKLDEPKSIGRAAQDLPQDMQMRADYLRKLLEAKGEPGYGTRLADNFTMGLGRPISGGVAAIAGEGTAGERYRAGVGAEEDYVKRAERNTNPYLGGAVDILGGLASGGPVNSLVRGAGKVAVAAPSRIGQIYRALLGNTGSSAIEGAARNAESLPSAAVGAGVGAVTGYGTGKVLGAVTSRLPGVRGAQKEVNEAVREGGAKGLKEEGSAIYKKLDDAGIKFKDTDTPKLVRDTVDKMKAEGFNRNIHDELTPILEDIGSHNGKPMTWTQVQNIRTQISDAKASDDKRVRRMAGHLSDVLENFVDTTKPTIPASKLGTISPGDPAKARDLYHRGSNAAKVEFMADKGMLTTKDATNKLRTNFGEEHNRIINPDRFSRFQNNPSQVAQIAEIAKGDPKLTATADFLSRQGTNLLSFGTLGLAGGGGAHYFGDTTGIGGGIGAGGATSLVLGLLGKAGARQLNRTIVNRGAARVDDLVRNIVTGSANRDIINTPRDALAKVLAAEQLSRAGSRYSSSFFNKE